MGTRGLTLSLVLALGPSRVSVYEEVDGSWVLVGNASSLAR